MSLKSYLSGVSVNVFGNRDKWWHGLCLQMACVYYSTHKEAGELRHFFTLTTLGFSDFFSVGISAVVRI